MWRRLIDLARRRRLDTELETELAHHFDALVSEHESRGLPPEAARAAARRDMGGLAQVQRCLSRSAWPSCDGDALAGRPLRGADAAPDRRVRRRGHPDAGPRVSASTPRSFRS